MAELLLLLPEYMAGVLDQTKRDAGCRGSKLQWSDNRLLMSNLADGGGKGALGGQWCPDVASYRSFWKLSHGPKQGAVDVKLETRWSRLVMLREEPASTRKVGLK